MFVIVGGPFEMCVDNSLTVTSLCINLIWCVSKQTHKKALLIYNSKLSRPQSDVNKIISDNLP